jgi:hypothetical protein
MDHCKTAVPFHPNQAEIQYRSSDISAWDVPGYFFAPASFLHDMRHGIGRCRISANDHAPRFAPHDRRIPGMYPFRRQNIA